MSFKLAQILTQAGILSTDEMDALFARHQEEAENGLSFDSLLALEGHLSPLDASPFIAQSLQLPPPDLDAVFAPSSEAIDALSAEQAETFHLFPWKIDSQIHLVSPLPFNSKLHKKLQSSLSLPLSILPIPQVFFAQLLERHYFIDPPEALLPLIDRFPLPEPPQAEPPQAEPPTSGPLLSIIGSPDLNPLPTLDIAPFQGNLAENAPTLDSPAFSLPSEPAKTTDLASFSDAFAAESPDTAASPNSADASEPSTSAEPSSAAAQGSSQASAEASLPTLVESLDSPATPHLPPASSEPFLPAQPSDPTPSEMPDAPEPLISSLHTPDASDTSDASGTPSTHGTPDASGAVESSDASGSSAASDASGTSEDAGAAESSDASGSSAASDASGTSSTEPKPSSRLSLGSDLPFDPAPKTLESPSFTIQEAHDSPRPTETAIGAFHPSDLPFETQPLGVQHPEFSDDAASSTDVRPVLASKSPILEERGTLEFSSFVSMNADAAASPFSTLSSSPPSPSASASAASSSPPSPSASASAASASASAASASVSAASASVSTALDAAASAVRSLSTTSTPGVHPLASPTAPLLSDASTLDEGADETSCPSLSTLEIEVLFKRAQTPNGALALGLCFFGGRLRQAGLFRSSKQTVKATQILADDPTRDLIQRQEISLREPTIFLRIQDSIVPYVGPIPQTETDQRFFALFTPKPRFVCLFPVRPFGRTVFILSGLKLKQPITPKHTEELMRCNSLLAQTLERFILAKKKGVEASTEAPEIQAVLDALMEHNVSALRQALRVFEADLQALEQPSDDSDDLLIEEPEILTPTVLRSSPPPPAEIPAIRETPSLAATLGLPPPAPSVAGVLETAQDNASHSPSTSGPSTSEDTTASEPAATSTSSVVSEPAATSGPSAASEPAATSGPSAASEPAATSGATSVSEPAATSGPSTSGPSAVSEPAATSGPSALASLSVTKAQISETEGFDLLNVPDAVKAALLSPLPASSTSPALSPPNVTADLQPLDLPPSAKDALLGTSSADATKTDSSPQTPSLPTETPEKSTRQEPNDDKTTFQDATLPLDSKPGLPSALDLLPSPKRSIGVTGILDAFDPSFLGLPVASFVANAVPAAKKKEAPPPPPPPAPVVSAADLVAQIALEPNDLFAEFDAEPLGNLLPLATQSAPSEPPKASSQAPLTPSKPVSATSTPPKTSAMDLISSFSSGSDALSLDFGDPGSLLPSPSQTDLPSPSGLSPLTSALPPTASNSSTQLIDATASVSDETAPASEPAESPSLPPPSNPEPPAASLDRSASSSRLSTRVSSPSASGGISTKSLAAAKSLVDLRVLLLQGESLPPASLAPPSDAATLLLPMLLNPSPRMRDVALLSFKEIPSNQVISSLLPLFESQLSLDDILPDGSPKPEVRDQTLGVVWSLLRGYGEELLGSLPALLSSESLSMRRLGLLLLEPLPLSPPLIAILVAEILAEGPLHDSYRSFLHKRRKDNDLAHWLGWLVSHIARAKPSVVSPLLKLLETLEAPGIEGAFAGLLESSDPSLQDMAFRQILKQIRDGLDKPASETPPPQLEHPRENLLSDDLFEPPTLPLADPHVERLLRKLPDAPPPLRDEILDLLKKIPPQRVLPTALSFFPGKLERLDILPDGTLHPSKTDSPDGFLWNLLRARISEAPYYLLALFYHRDRHTRMMSMLLLAGRPIPSLTPFIFRLLLDLNPVISEQARKLLASLHKSMAYQEILEWLREKVEFSDASQQVRVIRILAILRDPIVVPKLIDLLKNEDEDKEVLQSTGHALFEITKQNLGDSYRKWSKWWTKTGIKSERVDWLLEALELGETSLSEIANRELIELTGRDFGFQAHAGKRERAASVQQWRAWRKQNPIL